MKKFIFFLLLSCSFYAVAQQQTVTYSITPTPFEETTSITITVNGSSVNEATWGVTGNALYLWAWSFDSNDANSIDSPTNGAWTASNEVNKFTYNSATDTYSYTLTPTTFYNRTGIGRIGFLIKAKNGTGDKKSQDIFSEVGLFQANLVTPSVNSTTILTSGSNLNVQANNTNGAATYTLRANGVIINVVSGNGAYAFTQTNITSNQNYELEIVQGTVVQIKKFYVVVNPDVVSEALPTGKEEGINYDAADPTKAILVLDAPLKDFVYVAGSFNNWQPDNTYAMKKDPSSSKFWIELSGLTSGQTYTYQYWVVDMTPIAGSPALVKTADPYSTLVLSPFDDPYIPAASYPNLPAYPAGQDREVTVLKTGQTPYTWQVTNFNKPKKEDLVVYEVLIRDFDSHRNFQDLINRIDYFKNLNINAIELMPVMEFEGDEGWGYNPSFHMALDKFYGTADKMKEFVDLCHQNGIAVILDVALNHAFGRNPMDRMWMNDPDGDGWGGPSSENPYFNVTATHSYGVGNDFNHAQPRTKTYVKRVIKQWIEEFHIDGFRWDLTKGFTQACTSGNDACTNSTLPDREVILKDYADYSWSLDPNHYVIFEHLAVGSGLLEEQDYANYRVNETPSKGIMLWREIWNDYKQLALGYTADISKIGNGYGAYPFTKKRAMGYPESHDKDRMMYEAVTYGNTAGTASPRNNLNNALPRMSAIAATSLLVPGPKMIWHFADLGMDDSIFTCTDGSVNTDSDTTSGDCKLATKPQPQWTENWLSDPLRAQIHSDYARLIQLKTTQPVFEGDYTFSPDGTGLKQRIYIFDTTLPSGQIHNVVVLANFDTSAATINANFYDITTTSWYNLMDNSLFVPTSTASPIVLGPGEFRVYGDHIATLEAKGFESADAIAIYPNPSDSYFSVNTNTKTVQVYSMTGQLVKTFNQHQSGYKLDISDLINGIYLVKATDSDNRNRTMKLIKQ